MPRARTPSTRKKIRVIPKRRIRSVSPVNKSTRKRIAKERRKSTPKSKAVLLGRPGKAPPTKGKRMPLHEEMKAILLEKTTHLDFRNSFDITGRYTMGSKGYEFTFIPGIDLDKLRMYIQNDEALNNEQFWKDYNQQNQKLSIPPKRKRALKVSDLKNPNEREKKNLYTYVLGCIQEKMDDGYFDKNTNPSGEEEGPVNYDPTPESVVYSPTFRDDFDSDNQLDYDLAISRTKRD